MRPGRPVGMPIRRVMAPDQRRVRQIGECACCKYGTSDWIGTHAGSADCSGVRAQCDRRRVDRQPMKYGTAVGVFWWWWVRRSGYRVVAGERRRSRYRVSRRRSKPDLRSVSPRALGSGSSRRCLAQRGR